MLNPLEQFFSVEERTDGVYIKVSRIERDSVRVGNVIAALEESALVINLDSDLIKGVVQRASGEFELVGPPFEYYDIELEKYLLLKTSPYSASVKISPGIVQTGKKPTEKMIHYFLARKGITHGINPDKIKELIEEEIFEKLVTVAEATLPTPGEDAKVELRIILDPGIHPEVRENGSVDYRNIQTFTSVNEGDILAGEDPFD